LAGAALGAGDEVVDLVDERLHKRLVLWHKAKAESGQGYVPGFPEGDGDAADEVLAVLAALGKFCNLLIDIDINVQKPSRILVDDAFLLAIEEVE
jgi:hypothetical protein